MNGEFRSQYVTSSLPTSLSIYLSLLILHFCFGILFSDFSIKYNNEAFYIIDSIEFQQQRIFFPEKNEEEEEDEENGTIMITRIWNGK